MKLSEFIASLNEKDREEFEERAAIMEYDGCFLRKDAEMMAAKELMAKMKKRDQKG